MERTFFSNNKQVIPIETVNSINLIHSLEDLKDGTSKRSDIERIEPSLSLENAISSGNQNKNEGKFCGASKTECDANTLADKMKSSSVSQSSQGMSSSTHLPYKQGNVIEPTPKVGQVKIIEIKLIGLPILMAYLAFICF